LLARRTPGAPGLVNTRAPQCPNGFDDPSESFALTVPFYGRLASVGKAAFSLFEELEATVAFGFLIIFGFFI
jgi:hypothetical protein